MLLTKPPPVSINFFLNGNEDANQIKLCIQGHIAISETPADLLHHCETYPLQEGAEAPCEIFALEDMSALISLCGR